jgi:hypothetical protein
LRISNLGNYFSQTITGQAVYGNPDKLEIDEDNVLSKTGITYNVNGNIYLSGSTLNVYFIAYPVNFDTCGYVRGNGLGTQ